MTGISSQYSRQVCLGTVGCLGWKREVEIAGNSDCF